jgi:hypothetical protein
MINAMVLAAQTVATALDNHQPVPGHATSGQAMQGMILQLNHSKQDFSRCTTSCNTNWSDGLLHQRMQKALQNGNKSHYSSRMRNFWGLGHCKDF